MLLQYHVTYFSFSLPLVLFVLYLRLPRVMVAQSDKDVTIHCDDLPKTCTALARCFVFVEYIARYVYMKETL